MAGPGGPITRNDRALVDPVALRHRASSRRPSDDVVRAGSPVTYTYEVRNTGLTPLAGVTIGVDDPPCSPVTFVEGDTDGDGLLDPSEVFVFTCTATITETTTNTATVTGTPTVPGLRPGDPVTADDPATVEVVHTRHHSDQDRPPQRSCHAARRSPSRSSPPTPATSTSFRSSSPTPVRPGAVHRRERE